MARRLYKLDDAAEQVTDAIMAEVGGERISAVDLWRLLPNLMRRLRGRPSPPSGDLYVIPGDFFRAAHDRGVR